MFMCLYLYQVRIVVEILAYALRMKWVDITKTNYAGRRIKEFNFNV